MGGKGKSVSGSPIEKFNRKLKADTGEEGFMGYFALLSWTGRPRGIHNTKALSAAPRGSRASPPTPSCHPSCLATCSLSTLPSLLPSSGCSLNPLNCPLASHCSLSFSKSLPCLIPAARVTSSTCDKSPLVSGTTGRSCKKKKTAQG